MLKINSALALLLLSLLQVASCQAWGDRPRRVLVISENRPKVVVVKQRRSTSFSDGFFAGMFVERIVQSHPVVVLTAATAFTVACIYAYIASEPKVVVEHVEHTVVYVDEDDGA